MKRHSIPKTYADALRVIADLIEQNEALRLTVAEEQPDLDDTLLSHCSMFKEAIISSNMIRRRATIKVMTSRRPAIASIPQPELDRVIDELIRRGEIVVDRSKRTPSYRLAGIN